MKKYLIIIFSLLSVVFIGCDDMNDIQKQYVDLGEKVYLGKVDSIEVIPGLNRVKITWYVPADPKIENTIIYWNMRNDSIVKPFNRNAAGVQKDSIIIENLSEDTYYFEFRNTNNQGELSLFSAAQGRVWGEEFVGVLQERKMTSQGYDPDPPMVKLSLSSVSADDEVVYSKIKYTNEAGTVIEERIYNNMNNFTIPDLTLGGDYELITVFYPSDGIDTIYKKIVYESPLIKIAEGKKILSLNNTAGSMFFTRGESLLQKDPVNNLLVYTLDSNEQLVHTSTMEGLWNMYAFMYNKSADMLIVVDRDRRNYVSTYRFEGNKLTLLASQISRGYSFPAFMSFDGLFFTIAANGEVKRWILQPNGTWATPNGGDVMATGFDQYIIALGHQSKAILAVDNVDGGLWYYTTAADGRINASKKKIGKGWNNYINIYSFGDKLIAQDSNGEFWLHDFDLDTYWLHQ